MTGGPPPFEQVLELHGRAVLRFCVARAGAEHGEDCFQETMLAALRHYDELRDPTAARAWLLTIAARKVVDAARATARTPQPDADVEAHLPPVHDPAPADGDLWARVRALPPKQREAVALRFVADLDHAGIAAVMGTSEAAARRNVFEGVRRLRG